MRLALLGLVVVLLVVTVLLAIVAMTLVWRRPLEKSSPEHDALKALGRVFGPSAEHDRP